MIHNIKILQIQYLGTQKGHKDKILELTNGSTGIQTQFWAPLSHNSLPFLPLWILLIPNIQAFSKKQEFDAGGKNLQGTQHHQCFLEIEETEPYDATLFHGLVIFHCVYMYHIFFIHSAVDGHSGCFHVLAICKQCCNKHWHIHTTTYKITPKDLLYSIGNSSRYFVMTDMNLKKE